jgi:hypothetical protein
MAFSRVKFSLPSKLTQSSSSHSSPTPYLHPPALLFFFISGNNDNSSGGGDGGGVGSERIFSSSRFSSFHFLSVES